MTPDVSDPSREVRQHKMSSAQTSPRLSIIIATMQAAQDLNRCIQSVLAQKFTDWELLIVDGGSDDGTVDLIRKHEGRIAWWRSRRDHGIYDAWNEAIAHAAGEYIAFLGSDDTWHASSTLLEIFKEVGTREYDLVTGRGNLIDANGNGFQFGGPWNFEKVTRRITICHPGCLHRTDLFQRYGNFDTSYRIAADYEFILRLPRTIRTLHVGTPFVDIGDGGISRRRRWLTLQERYRAQASCPRVGHLRAAMNFVDKLWRIPVARALGIPN